MKHITLLVAFSFLLYTFLPAQNVGIGTTHPAYKLTVQTPGGNWGFMHTDSTVYLGSFINSGTSAEFGTRSNHPFYLFANNFDFPPAITIDKGGVNVGIGTITPINTFQIGNTPGFSGNQLAIGNGTQAMSFFQSSTISNWYTNTAFALMPINGGSGYLGIATQTPTNFLQIGSVGGTGYSGNAFAIGNGTSAMAFNQLVLQCNWQSSSNIYIKPQNGGVLGRVYNSGAEYITGSANIGGDASIGGNTSMLGSLNVNSSGGPGIYVTGIYYPTVPTPNNKLTYCPQAFCGTEDLSIQASGDIWANGFYALSDARIKDIIGVSNNSEDLKILNAIEVTNYTMKDKMIEGDKQFKKVIAQQVEKVYPQIVSKGSNYIPNVYTNTSKIEKTNSGYLLRFDVKHNISDDAKKLEIILKNGKVEYVDIKAIPSTSEVIIDAPDFFEDTLFVYGQQVNDCRTVDYNGLTTLNISATQELSKLIKEQQEEIAQLKKEMEELKKRAAVTNISLK